jgi:hypothetical protein
VPNNYETDLMKPYLDKTCSIANIPSYETASEAAKVSLKVNLFRVCLLVGSDRP